MKRLGHKQFRVGLAAGLVGLGPQREPSRDRGRPAEPAAGAGGRRWVLWRTEVYGRKTIYTYREAADLRGAAGERGSRLTKIWYQGLDPGAAPRCIAMSTADGPGQSVVTTYTFDAEGQLTGVRAGGGTTFAYDAGGKLLRGGESDGTES